MTGLILICPRCIYPMDYHRYNGYQYCKRCKLQDQDIVNRDLPEIEVTLEDAINLRNYKRGIVLCKDLELLTRYDVQTSKHGKYRNHMRIAVLRKEILSRIGSTGCEDRGDDYDENAFLWGVLKDWEVQEKKYERIKRLEKKARRKSRKDFD